MTFHHIFPSHHAPSLHIIHTTKKTIASSSTSQKFIIKPPSLFGLLSPRNPNSTPLPSFLSTNVQVFCFLTPYPPQTPSNPPTQSSSTPSRSSRASRFWARFCRLRARVVALRRLRASARRRDTTCSLLSCRRCCGGRCLGAR